MYEYGQKIGSSDEQLLVVNADLALRHRLAADSLSLPAVKPDMVERQAEFIDVLADNYNQDYTIEVMDAEDIRDALNSAVRCFREMATEQGRSPFVISLDPVFLDHSLADYIFQESRASLVSARDSMINLEHNPRGYVNRFAMLNEVSSNGAGKSSQQQLQEILDLLDHCSFPVSLAFVEDYVNTGRGILNRFEEIMKRPDIQTTIFAGLMNHEGRQSFRDIADAVSVFEIRQEQHMRHMDLSDLLPTLGGRMLGKEEGATTSVAVTEEGAKIPLAVDAILGRYPWQADIYKSEVSSDFLQVLGKLCLAASSDYWRTLENDAGRSLHWEDLQSFNGVLKTCYPVKDLSSVEEVISVQQGPYQTIQHIKEQYNVS
jgi:hypothetical protein